MKACLINSHSYSQLPHLTDSPLGGSNKKSTFEAWSSHMRYLNRCGAVLTALLLTATQAEAQRRPGAGARTARTLSTEQILRSYERLELSAEQMTTLEVMQEEADPPAPDPGGLDQPSEIADSCVGVAAETPGRAVDLRSAGQRSPPPSEASRRAMISSVRSTAGSQ